MTLKQKLVLEAIKEVKRWSKQRRDELKKYFEVGNA